MSSSMCLGSGADAVYAVTGSRPSAGAEVVEPVDAKRHAHPPLRAELVDQERELAPAHVAKEQRGAAGAGDAVGDLGDLEPGIDLGGDLMQLTLAAKMVEPVAQI